MALALAEGLYSAFNTAIAGGRLSDILKSGLMSVASAELSSLSSKFGLSSASFGSGRWMAGVLVNGLEGGGIRAIEGGSFTNGFLSSAVIQAAKAPIASIKQYDFRFNGMLMRSTADGIVGGTMAAITGGNFGDAALTFSFRHLCFEDMALTYSLGKGIISAEKYSQEHPDKSFIAVCPLDVPILNKLPILYPFVHTGMYFNIENNETIMGLAPEVKNLTGIFGGVAIIENDITTQGFSLKDYVVLNVPKFSEGFDAAHMQSIVNQQAADWQGPSAPRYVLPIHNCHDL